MEEPITELLSIRAAYHGHSMEEEVRQILRHTLLQDTQSSANLAESIQKRFTLIDEINELPIRDREGMRQSLQFK